MSPTATQHSVSTTDIHARATLRRRRSVRAQQTYATSKSHLLFHAVSKPFLFAPTVRYRTMTI